MDPTLIRRIIEAALLASSQPLSLTQLAALFPEDAPPPPGSLEQALGELAEQNGKRGIALIEVASGFRFQVDAELQPWVSRLWAERPPRYSRALLETLALIAYRQPITRGEIEQIRGVAVSTHIIKTLEEREWIRVVGHRDVPGRPALFGTTRGFLDYFGLKALDDLPALTELQDLPDLEPELPLEGIAAAQAAEALPGEASAAEGDAPDSGADADRPEHETPGEHGSAEAPVSSDQRAHTQEDGQDPERLAPAPASEETTDEERALATHPDTATDGRDDPAGEDDDDGARAGTPHDSTETQAGDNAEPEHTA